MNCLIVGASSGLGKALAEELAQRGHNLFLVSSDARDLRALESDLQLRHNIKVATLELDLREFEVATLLSALSVPYPQIDSLFLTAAVYDDNEQAPIADATLQDLVRVNYLAAIRIVNALLPNLTQSKNANIVGVGSIAATRPRAQNMVYGSTKAALEFYFMGLRSSLAETSSKVQFYRLGYMRSQMTYGKKLLFPAANPQTCAKVIADNLNRDLGLVFLPSWWRWIMLIYSLIPRQLLSRLQQLLWTVKRSN